MITRRYQSILRSTAAALGVAAALFVISALVWLTLHTAQTPPVIQPRVEERLKTLSTVRAASSQILENYAWQNTDKGFVRLPIERAKEVVLEEWKNPAAARSNMLARAAVLLAVPPAPATNVNQ